MEVLPPVRITKKGEIRCGASYRAPYGSRSCVRSVNHDGLHRSWPTTRGMRFFFDDNGLEVKSMTETEWQNHLVELAASDLKAAIDSV